MCLIKDKKVRNNHHKEDGYCIAYKIVSNLNISPFNYLEYEYGCNYAKFGGIKDYLNFVFCGLHLMLSLKEAKRYALTHCFSSKIIKVYYKPEDVIAYGHSIMFPGHTEFHQGRSVVVSSCLVKSLKDVGSCRK